MMTKKDYKLLAFAVSRIENHETKRRTAYFLIDKLKNSYNNFNEVAFLDGCFS